jgi:predicted RNase H-like HicB family nuclease
MTIFRILRFLVTSSGMPKPFVRTFTDASKRAIMKTFTAIIERCPDTGLFVGHVPGFPGAHSQGETIDELSANLKEVIEMLMEDGEPKLETEFVGVQNVMVA